MLDFTREGILHNISYDKFVKVVSGMEDLIKCKGLSPHIEIVSITDQLVYDYMCIAMNESFGNMFKGRKSHTLREFKKSVWNEALCAQARLTDNSAHNSFRFTLSVDRQNEPRSLKLLGHAADEGLESIIKTEFTRSILLERITPNEGANPTRFNVFNPG